MTFPAVAVKVSFGTDPLATPSYSTLPAADVRALDIETGKHSEFDGSDPGTLEVELENNGRQYDPTYAAGSHYGTLTPGRRTQVTATYSGTTYELFNGFASAWPNAFGARTGRARLKANGGFQLLQRKTAPDGYSSVIDALNPVAWYRLGEDGGHSLADSSGNGRHARWVPDYVEVDGTKGVIVSNDGAITLPDAPAFAEGLIPAAAVPSLRPLSIEFWIRIAKPPKPLGTGGASMILNTISPNIGVNPIGVTVQILDNAQGEPGVLQFLIYDNSGHVVQGTTSYSGGFYSLCDDVPHHVVCTLNSAGTAVHIYVDGKDRANSNIYAGVPSAVAASSNIILNFAGGWDGSCVIDELAFYSTELTPTQVGLNYAAGWNPWIGDLSGIRMLRLLGAVAWPGALMDLDFGQIVLGPYRGAGATVLDHLDKVAATEQGILTEAHHDGGKIRWQSFGARFTDSRSGTVQTLFSDQTSDLAGTAVPYEAVELVADDKPAANVVTCKWVGGEAVSTNQASVDDYGDIPITIQTLLETAEDATNLAQWILTEQASLFTRIKSVTVMPSAMRANFMDRTWVAALARQEGDRIRVIHQPAATGAVIDQQLYIIGVEHHVSKGAEEWRTTFHLAPAITTAYWVLGTSALGTNTRLAY